VGTRSRFVQAADMSTETTRKKWLERNQKGGGGRKGVKGGQPVGGNGWYKGEHAQLDETVESKTNATKG